MTRTQLKVILLAHTPEPEKVCATAAKMCYSPLHVDDLKERVQDSDQGRFLRGIVASGHLSVLEHASFTFSVEGVSRVLLAQLTRHRIASFSVQSQRYVSLADDFSYVVPPSVDALGEEAVRRYKQQMETCHQWYTEWQEQLGNNEDARFVLPSACETRLTMTMNARELLHFFSLRCCNRAQWEIRALAEQMLILCKSVAPAIFEKAGPGCVSGNCPEGSRSCGQASSVREKYANLK